jgi:hypothetical protein
LLAERFETKVQFESNYKKIKTTICIQKSTLWKTTLNEGEGKIGLKETIYFF